MATIDEAWTVEFGGAGSGSLTEYDKAVPIRFEDRLNAPGFFDVHVTDLDGNAEPSRDDLCRMVWDKGGGNEQEHFAGYVTSVRQQGSSDSFRVHGFSLDGLLWQSGIGGIREFSSVTPFDVISTSSSPSNLMVTADGTTLDIGSTTLEYAADGTVANQIDSTNEGGFGTSGGSLTTGDYRAASDRQLVNIQRLCMVGRENTTDFGLEYHAVLVNGTGSNEPTEPRFALAKRRERASSYTAESYTVDQDLAPANRGDEGVTAADLVKVIGEGTGSDREESQTQGSGKLQRVITDKTVINQTNADNMATRLQNLLDPSTEVVTGWYYDHATDTRAGDDVVIKEDGESDSTLRCFSRLYDFRRKGFRLVAGRPKKRAESAFWNIENQLGGYGQAPQKTDRHTAVNSNQPAINSSGGETVSDGGFTDVTLNFTDRDYDPSTDQAIAIHVQVQSDATGGADGNDSTVRVEVADTIDGSGNTGTAIHNSMEASIPDEEILNLPVYVASEQAIDFWGSGSQSDIAAKVVNLSGGSRDILLQLSAWVDPPT